MVLCDDDVMKRGITRLGVAVTGAALLFGAGMATTAAGAAPPVAPPGISVGDDGTVTFELPANRVAALEAAGSAHPITIDYPPQPDGVPWPTAEWTYGGMPDGTDTAAVEAILAAAFPAELEDPGAGVHAVVVVQGGRVVLEQYGINTDPAEPHISWSMAKSITQAMYGAALLDGMPIDLYGPAPVAAWNEQPDDPRAAITIDQMLLMRSGLEWNEEYEGTSDVIEMLFVSGAADRGGFAAAKPLEFEPDTVWEYSTGTSMILGRILGDYIGLGDEGAAWAQEHLFGPIGITTVRHTLDEVGAMSSGSMIDMTALDFARFGLLYLRGGTWDGTQILPAGWADYARLPSPDAPLYGHHWWIPAERYESMTDFPQAFTAQGFNGQRIVVVPESDLVVVVLSNDGSELPDETAYGLVRAFSPGVVAADG